MKTFILILSFWNAEESYVDTYVIDYGLSGEDCIAQMYLWESVEQHGGWIACEFDNGEF